MKKVIPLVCLAIRGLIQRAEQLFVRFVRKEHISPMSANRSAIPVKAEMLPKSAPQCAVRAAKDNMLSERHAGIAAQTAVSAQMKKHANSAKTDMSFLMTALAGNAIPENITMLKKKSA